NSPSALAGRGHRRGESQEVIRPAWDQRILRARRLAGRHASASAMLDFYQRLLEVQRQVFESFSCRTLDISARERFPVVFDFLESAGTQEIARQAAELRSQGPEQWSELIEDLIAHNGQVRPVRLNSVDDFAARAFLQPWAENLGDACPGCRREPQVS